MGKPSQSLDFSPPSEKLIVYRVDDVFCTGPKEAPVSNGKLGGLKFSNTAKFPPASVNIKDWISGIGSGSGIGDPKVDALSDFDRSVDGSIGGLDVRMEKMYNSQRSVPLFEFRDLDPIYTPGVEQFMKDVDSAIQTFHGDFANTPTRMKRDAPASCVRPFAANATSSTTSSTVAPPSPTGPAPVAPVDPPSQPSCVAAPGGNGKDSHEGELQKAAAFFCSQYADSTVQTSPINIAETIIAGARTEGRETVDVAYLYPPRLGNQDDVYDISITSVPNYTPNGGYNLATPVANNQCADILHSAWKQCKLCSCSSLCHKDPLTGLGNNQGRGGSITAGCLVYNVTTKF